MAGKCKLCNSPFRQQVEARLIKGETVTSLSEWLKTQGELIAHPSIQRHRDNHLAATMKENGRLPADTSKIDENAPTGNFEPFIDESTALKRIYGELAETDVFESVLKERKFTQLLLEKIMQKQLIIVHELQAQYIDGKAGYPDSQIRGLKTILDMANTLPTYKNENLLNEIKRDNKKQYDDKITKSAIDLAAIESEKYVKWHVLKNDVYICTPLDDIKALAQKLYPHDFVQQLEWENEKIAKWDAIFYGHIPCGWNDERKILNTIDRRLDETHDDCELDVLNELIEIIDSIRPKIIDQIIRDFDTPEAVCENGSKLHEIITSWIEKIPIKTTEFAS
jgi:hypothetical protein